MSFIVIISVIIKNTIAHNHEVAWDFKKKGLYHPLSILPNIRPALCRLLQVAGVRIEGTLSDLNKSLFVIPNTDFQLFFTGKINRYL